jgi:hypothetical protein
MRGLASPVLSGLLLFAVLFPLVALSAIFVPPGPGDPEGPPMAPIERSHPPPDSLPTPSGPGSAASVRGVGDGIVVDIEVWPSLPELGHPLYLNLSITGGSAPYAATWIVDWNATFSLLGPSLGLVLRPTDLAPINLTVEVADQYQRFGTDSRTVNLTPPPNLTAVPIRATGDPGRPFPLNVTVVGGAPPYVLDWRILPNGSSGVATVVAPGSFLQPVVPESAGPLLIRLTLTDSLESATSATYSFGPIGFPLAFTFSAPPDLVETGQPIALTARISGGTPPYLWTVDPSATLDHVAEGTMGLAEPGTAPWSGTPNGPGNLTIIGLVLDAVGGTASDTVGTRVVPALSVRFALSDSMDSGRPTVTIAALVDGGVPPYLLCARAGTNASESRNLSGPGSTTLTLASPGTGSVEVQFAVADARNGNFSVSQRISILPAPIAPVLPVPAADPVGPALGPIAGVLVLVGVGAGLLAWIRWGRERRDGPSAALDGERARAVVARVLSESEEVDAESLLLQLQEEGVSAGLARTAISELEQLGRIQRETGADGEELLCWLAPTPPEEAPPAPSPERP